MRRRIAPRIARSNTDTVDDGHALGLEFPLLLPRVNIGRGEDDPGPGGGGGGGSDDHASGSGEDQARGLKGLVIDRIDPVLLGLGRGIQLANPVSNILRRSLKLDSSLERIFGSGATKLAIEFEGMSNVETVHNISDSSMEDEDISTEVAASTPGREGSKKRLRSGDDTNFGDISGLDTAVGGLSSGEDSEEGFEGDSKKQRVGGSDKEISDVEEVADSGGLGLLESGETVQMKVTPGVTPGTDQEPESQQVSDGSCVD